MLCSWVIPCNRVHRCLRVNALRNLGIHWSQNATDWPVVTTSLGPPTWGWLFKLLMKIFRLTKTSDLKRSKSHALQPLCRVLFCEDTRSLKLGYLTMIQLVWMTRKKTQFQTKCDEITTCQIEAWRQAEKKTRWREPSPGLQTLSPVSPFLDAPLAAPPKGMAQVSKTFDNATKYIWNCKRVTPTISFFNT